MTSPKPPREWILNVRDGIINPGPTENIGQIVHFKGFAPKQSDIVHVIEFSAYEQTCKERVDLKQRLEQKVSLDMVLLESYEKELDEERLVWQAHYGLQNEKINAAIKERDELKIMIERINTHIFPGEIDSIDSLRILIKERDEALAEARRLSECYEETKLNWSEALASAKDHEDDWKRIQDAEREIETLAGSITRASFAHMEKDKLLAECEKALERIRDNPASDSTGTINNFNYWTRWAKHLAHETLTKLKASRKE